MAKEHFAFIQHADGDSITVTANDSVTPPLVRLILSFFFKLSFTPTQKLRSKGHGVLWSSNKLIPFCVLALLEKGTSQGNQP